MTRDELTEKAQELGEAINGLREAALEANMPFVAGIVRGAEEAVLVAHTLLNDPAVKTREL